MPKFNHPLGICLGICMTKMLTVNIIFSNLEFLVFLRSMSHKNIETLRLGLKCHYSVMLQTYIHWIVQDGDPVKLSSWKARKSCRKPIFRDGFPKGYPIIFLNSESLWHASLVLVEGCLFSISYKFAGSCTFICSRQKILQWQVKKIGPYFFVTVSCILCTPVLNSWCALVPRFSGLINQ